MKLTQFLILTACLLLTACETTQKNNSIDHEASCIFNDLMEPIQFSKLQKITGGGSGSGIYKVIAGSKNYILRIIGQRVGQRGVKSEIAISRFLGDIGVAPQVYASSSENRAYVMEEADGGPLLQSKLSDDLVIKLAKKLKALHEPRKIEFRRKKSPNKILQSSINDVERVLPNSYLKAINSLSKQLLLLDNSNAYVLVHSDINPGNILTNKDDILLIDWEDACTSHPYLDVAAVFIFYDLAPNQRKLFFYHYFQGTSNKLDEAAIDAAYRITNLIYAVRNYGRAIRNSGLRNSSLKMKNVDDMRKLFKEKKWQEIIARLNDKDYAYTVSQFFLEEALKAK